MVLDEEKSYGVQFSLTSNIASDNSLAKAFEVNKFFIASAGYNFPCVHPKLGSTYIVVDASSVPIGANLNIGDLDKLSMYPRNTSANMVLIKLKISKYRVFQKKVTTLIMHKN